MPSPRFDVAWVVKFYDESLQQLTEIDYDPNIPLPIEGTYVNLDKIHGRVRYVVLDYNWNQVQVYVGI